MQIAGSILAIPVGLGSAYSLYRANFSVDTTCQVLRASIISMIDKKIDATTRRMLVRHDVETFEKTCGGVDPDAEAAFRTLLAEPAAPVRRIEVPAKVDAVKRVEAPARPDAKTETKTETRTEAAKAEPAKEIHKSELRAALPAAPAREPKERARETAKAAEAQAEPHDVGADARWLDAVRGALVAHEKTVTPDAPADAVAARGAPPHPLAVPPPPVAAAPVAVAPTLPPPTQIAEPAGTTPPAHSADPDRLVPPASIPDQSGPKPTGWISNVPFVGQVLAK